VCRQNEVATALWSRLGVCVSSHGHGIGQSGVTLTLCTAVHKSVRDEADPLNKGPLLECAGRTKWRRRFGHGSACVFHPKGMASAKAVWRGRFATAVHEEKSSGKLF
jgi:hypothetical protein